MHAWCSAFQNNCSSFKYKIMSEISKNLACLLSFPEFEQIGNVISNLSVYIFKPHGSSTSIIKTMEKKSTILTFENISFN